MEMVKPMIVSERLKSAVLPQTLVSLRFPRTMELTPELAGQTPEDKIDQAIKVYTQLVQVEPEPLRSSRQFSLAYFEACQEGPPAKRAKARWEFWGDHGVFSDKKYLHRPEAVKPGMETANLNAADYNDELKQEVESLSLQMFGEYFVVKNLIAFPDRADLVVWARRQPVIGSRAKQAKLPLPRLQLSLLLKDYIDTVTALVNRARESNWVAFLGIGKGEEMAELVRREKSTLCLDAHDFPTLEHLFKQTFSQAGIEVPEIVQIGKGSEVDESKLRSLQKRDRRKPVVMVQSEIDFAKEDAIPEPLRGSAGVAASIYTLHEIDGLQKSVFVKNMAEITSDSVVIFDANPTNDALQRVVLPVIDRCGMEITGKDAMDTHILGERPELIRGLVERAAPNFSWSVKEAGPPLPARLLPRLQIRAVGKRR